ncbi:MAG: hypothetical protein GXO90_10300 [FCB group bacterium]|nr:hypothetical protein [FCB group bacterium]
MQNWTDLNPQDVGLSKRIRLVKNNAGHIALVLDRKSRVILKDGERILRIAAAVRSRWPEAQFSLITTAPVCSKTTHLLETHRISILKVEPGEL